VFGLAGEPTKLHAIECSKYAEPMLFRGQVVETEVVQVFVWGVFCKHQDQELLIRIPETSWIASFCACHQFAVVGDRLTVKILYVDPQSGQVSASVREAHANPWEDGRLAPGLEYQSRVVRRVANADRCGNSPGYLLELFPGSFVMLCEREEPLEVGGTVRVVIQTSDFSRRSVTVALWNSQS